MPESTGRRGNLEDRQAELSETSTEDGRARSG
jgi:hypothetical protein